MFSWNQARFALSGLYGVRTALEHLERCFPETTERIAKGEPQYAPLHYIVSNADKSLATVGLSTMRHYAALVDDQEFRERVLGMVEAEYAERQRVSTGPAAVCSKNRD